MLAKCVPSPYISSMEMMWQTKAFSDLSTDELYALLQLRASVFVVEQRCPYQDLDNNDQISWHLMGRAREHPQVLAAYARLFVTEGEIVIGRLVTHESCRGMGLGRAMMQRALRVAETIPDGPSTIYLMAQHYLESFYQSFGFVTMSEPYEEDGIAHVDMRKVKSIYEC